MADRDGFNRTLFDVLPIGLAISDMDGRLSYVNQAYASIIGYGVGQARRLTYWQVTPREYKELRLEQLASLEKLGRYGPYEKEYTHKDGHRVPVRLSGVLIKQNGRDMIWSSVEDISLSKSMLDLKAKTELLEATFDNMADGITMIDSDLKVVAFNRRFLELMNLPPERIKAGDSFESVIRYFAEQGQFGSGPVEVHVRERVALAKKLKPLNFERTNVDGTVLEVYRQPMQGGGFVTRHTDITERKRSDRAVQESEAKFRAFTAISSDWFWEMDGDLRFTYFSTPSKKIPGFNPEIYIGKTRREVRLGEADDEDWKRHLDDMDEHREFRNFEYDLKLADGDFLTISISGYPVFDDDGVFRGYYGTGRDITERKRAEKEIRHSEERFRALYHQSPLGVLLEDYSAVKRLVDRLNNEGVTDLKRYLTENEDVLKEAMFSIRLLDANDTLIRMFGASSFAEYKQYEEDLDSWRQLDLRRFYIGKIAALAAGKTTHVDEFRDFELGGAGIDIRRTTRVVDDSKDDWSEVISIHEDITARKVAEEKLLQQATIDQVTGLPNRALLFDRMSRSMEHARRDKRHVGLIFVDLDRFKQVNDSRGHAAGDQLLQQVGGRLVQLVRNEDTVARLGGDEFIILLHDMELPDGPKTVAAKIIKAFGDPFDLDGRETFITASLGVAIFPEDGEYPEMLLQNADAAMYQSKRHGRNTFHFFTEGLNDHAEHIVRVAERLRHALDRGDLKLNFQPVVNVQNNGVASIEALIRWDDTVLKAVPPGQLIAVAEETGFILPIEKWVLGKACGHVAAWRADGAPELQLSVNISRSHLRSHDLVDAVNDALGESGLPAAALIIEITENFLVEDSEHILRRLNELSELGVRLALDDFGTGYSSLGYLKKFKVDQLKIDRSFISDIESQPADLALVEAIIAMSRSLDLTVVAEGVETPGQLELLRQRGCNLIQGFHFSQPLTVEEMTEYLVN